MSHTKVKVTTALFALAAGFAMLLPHGAAAQTAAKSTVRVVHASPDAPAVDIYINDKKTLSNIAYKRVTSYTALDAGTYNIKVYPTSAAGKGDPALQTQITLNPGWDYTVAAVGKLASLQAKVIPDNLNPAEKGKTKVRAYHFAPTAPAVNVAVKNGSTLVRGLAFPNATDYLTVDAGRVNLSIQNAADNSEVLAINNANLAPTAVQSVFVFGLTGEEKPALSSLVTTDRKAAGTTSSTTPATGAGDSITFMLISAGLVAAAGLGLKKLATVEENLR